MPQINGNDAPAFVISEVYIAESSAKFHRDTGAENNSEAEHHRYQAARRKGQQSCR